MSEFTKGEAWRRLRAAAALARTALHLPKNAPCEIGLRALPQSIDHVPHDEDEARAVCYPMGDDLADYAYFEQHVKYLKPNDVLHLYVSHAIGFGEYELYDIVVVWIGNDEWDPMIIDTRFVRYE